MVFVKLVIPEGSNFFLSNTTSSDNILNFDSLEKNSIDLYSSYKSIYLQDRENKINNSDDDGDDWGNFDN